jgi:aminobenzoyl-glutamate transport protein
LIAFAGTWVTNRFLEPRLGTYSGKVQPEPMERLSPLEKKGIWWVIATGLIWFGLIFMGLYPEEGFLRGPENSVLKSPVLKGFIAFLFLIAGSMGIVYGFVTGKFKGDSDVVKSMVDSFKTLASFLVLVFFASQFVAFFKESNLGLVIAVKGANWLQQIDIGLIPLMLLFVFLSGFINLFMGSASAKWAIMGPVFIPMFMILGYTPELSQAIFRVGDSVTNIISPMMSFFALIIVYFEKYDEKAGLGTIISTMLPYTLVFTLLWSLLLVAWVLLDIPLGPGAGIYLR